MTPSASATSGTAAGRTETAASRRQPWQGLHCRCAGSQRSPLCASHPRSRRILAVVGAFGGVTFVALTWLVASGVTQLIDDGAAGALPDSLRGRLIVPTKVALHVLDPRVSMGLAILVGAVAFVTTRHSRQVVRTVAVVGSWSVITIVLKDVVDRRLPHTGDWAYPSGHVGGAIVLCTIAVIATLEVVPPGRPRRGAVAMLVALPVALGVLLVATGAHWLTDVSGGALLSITCLAAIEFLLVRDEARARFTPERSTSRPGHMSMESDGERLDGERL